MQGFFHSVTLYSVLLSLCVNIVGYVQSVGSFGVIWPAGASGSWYGDKQSRNGGVWSKAGLVMGPGWRGEPCYT